ncbi:protein-glutamate O-methyltransferase CheR [Psychrobacillus sp. FSL K6-2365]|jgi:chemotaxis protein methyltransferase CheR|uniref:CheR family methyltransferase n=1 Tax=unclassified Psychrobacillus TaxID=2636677 RepID=UPI0030FCB318
MKSKSDLPQECLESNSRTEKIEITLLLEGIFQRYGHDFRGYSYPSINRRIKYRMELEGLTSISYLQQRVLYEPEMMRKLLKDFSINVTEMFRDPEFYSSFRKRVVPLLHSYPFIRIWHAGCSTGEEAYSMAILLYEEGLYKKSKIYATDMNMDVLEKAEKGIFSFEKMKQYTSNYQKAGGLHAFSEYYTADQYGVKFKPFLSENIVFARHNLVTDSSFNEFNVIICRNVLIYFDKQLQNQVHGLFQESLSRFGVLGLGSKESIRFSPYMACYEEIDAENKLYKKID